jgi:hypothetical protein
MRAPRRLLALLICAAALGGCGSGSGGTSSTSMGPNSPTVNRTGVKAQERESHLRLSHADCRALGAALAKRAGRSPAASGDFSPPLSLCRLSGQGVRVTVSLDAGYGAHQRYYNRIDEQEQFGAPDPARMPHAVPGVGDPAAEGHDAEWVPAYRTLFAVRGNRWITIAYSVPGLSRPQARAGAAALARLAFRVSSH